MKALVEAIYKTPIIDHHAHNLLLPTELAKRPFLSITTEASGAALKQTSSTLSHIRAVKQLAEVLECQPTWEAVQKRVEEERQKPGDLWARRCFEGIETVLIDDGLDRNTVRSYEWHNRLTRSRCKRIVRIEAVFEEIFGQYCQEYTASGGKWDIDKLVTESRATVMEKFMKIIEEAISNPDVAGFKSVICYRTGLAISSADEEMDGTEFNQEWATMLHQGMTGEAIRLEHEILSPYVLHLASGLIQASWKPLQFHTGLGDNDITLRLSSSSHLQTFIKEFPRLQIVLLHASYPFTREAGYLASVYENVYLDIGEVFPMVSQEGQERVIAQALELCPSEKLTWSTDGHWFPETYLLAVMQFREALKQVLGAYVQENSLTEQQAIRVVEDVLFRTSNRLYQLDLPLSPLSSPRKLDLASHTKVKFIDLELFTDFLDKNPAVNFIRLQWLDYTSTLRVRILPINHALKLFKQGKFIGITKACLGLLQNDIPTTGFIPVGEYSLVPCFKSLRRGKHGQLASYATVQCEFREKILEEVSICPRTALRKVVEKARKLKAIDFLVGFECEVVFMSSETKLGAVVYGEIPVSQGHAWSATRALHGSEMMEVLETIIVELGKADIDVQQFHPESGPGQYELVTGPLPPLEAVDTLLATRDIISTVASSFSLRATFVPKPLPYAAGTGSHFHVSMLPETDYEMFYAGVLEHLQAIMAFTYCNVQSYERAVDSAWAGGRWVTWGTQNREAPLRKIEGSHWEFKSADGFANMYLVLAAVIGAGLQSILDGQQLKWKDCSVDPALLNKSQRLKLGITENLPGNLAEAFKFLGDDHQLKEIMGKGVVDTFLSVKSAEAEMLENMAPSERRKWLIERY